MDWVLYNGNSVLKGFHGTSEWLLACHNIHVEILHLFQQDVPFLMQRRHQSFPLFSPFVGTFTCLKFGVLQLFLIFWSISTIFLLVRNFLLTHFSPVLPLCRNQPIDLKFLLMARFLNNETLG